jgi:precorrin-2 dehydrogenase/sirohydrochlorin ferrochelatase
MLDVTGRLVVIVGGGAVAVRKVKGLLDAGATRIRVVAPHFHAEMPTGVERIVATYEVAHLKGAQLVFAATNSSTVNEQITADARERGVLVSRADEGDGGDFVTPARFQEGEVIVTVTAGSPALAVVIRNELAQRIDPRHLKMAHAMRELRPLIVGGGLTPQERAAVLRDLASDDAMATLETSKIEGLRGWIRQRHPEVKL